VSTILFSGLGPAAAVSLLNRALASPHEVSGAAYLPVSASAALPALSGLRGVAALRLEGPPPSVEYRRARVLTELASGCEAASLDGAASIEFWRAVRDVRPLADLGDRAVWRVSVAPSRGAELGETIARQLDAAWYLDWGGGLLWAAIAGAEHGGAAAIRAAIRGPGGHDTGHATLIKGTPTLRRTIPVFEPQPPALAALNARVKESFDPHRILNRGRMVEGG
jgi:glycolate oxidase FAD binding subunit